MRRLLPVLLLLSLVVPALASEKESELKFTVVKGDTGLRVVGVSAIPALDDCVRREDQEPRELSDLR